MTVIEAIKMFKGDIDYWKNKNPLIDTEHYEMAIRSLEAWEKVREEVLKTQTYKMFESDTDLYVERKDVLKIIDKHLKEVGDPCEYMQ